MKKVLCTLTFFFVVLIGCGGGGGGGGNGINPPIPPVDNKAEWTVMIYIGGDNNVANCAIDVIQELEQIGSSDKVEFTVLADVFFAGYNYSGSFEYVSIANNNGEPVAPMMHADKHPEDGIQSHLSDTKAVLYPADSFNSADPNNLTYFIKWSTQRFPAKRYALIIWNHGGSWTPGRYGSAVVQDMSQAGGEFMNISEIKSAIQSSGIHLDVLDFDACNMASIEVMYELRDVTDYICASQKTEPGEGNNYTTLASSVLANPTCSPEQFGKILVDSYINFYSEVEDYSVTRSLVKTEKLDALATTINNLSTWLTKPETTSNTDLLNRFYEPIRFMRDADLYNFMDVFTSVR